MRRSPAFQASGGQPPKGLKLIGRWTAADFSGGFVLLEGDDPKALTEFALMWSDLMELKVVPVIEDPDLGEVLARGRHSSGASSLRHPRRKASPYLG
jgi:hypothetical protein